MTRVDNMNDKAPEARGKGTLLGLIPDEKVGVKEHLRAPNELINRYRKLLPDVTSTVADAVEQLGLRAIVPAHILRPISEGALIGSAVTARYVPTQHSSGFRVAHDEKAPAMGGRDLVTLSERGDVLVINSSAEYSASSFGGLMANSLIEAGMEGIVVDGSIRDIASMRLMGLKAWSRGVTPRTGKHRLELAEFNGLVEVHGVQVNPGDLVLADSDGIVIIPFDYIERVIDLVEVAIDNERKLVNAIKGGSDPSELAKILPPHKW
ncbi:RraA family protein [Alcaligenaceae bacterium]|nr:RraA family protein [Alcaligenaceae bacterium]